MSRQTKRRRQTGNIIATHVEPLHCPFPPIIIMRTGERQAKWNIFPFFLLLLLLALGHPHPPPAAPPSPPPSSPPPLTPPHPPRPPTLPPPHSPCLQVGSHISQYPSSMQQLQCMLYRGYESTSSHREASFSSRETHGDRQAPDIVLFFVLFFNFVKGRWWWGGGGGRLF